MADLLNDMDMTSATRCVSEAFMPKAIVTLPTISAVLPRASPEAEAAKVIPLLRRLPAVLVKPNFANSVSNCAISVAVNFVSEPRCYGHIPKLSQLLPCGSCDSVDICHLLVKIGHSGECTLYRTE